MRSCNSFIVSRSNTGFFVCMELTTFLLLQWSWKLDWLDFREVKKITYGEMMYLHYFDIFGLHNDPFEDCKQWKLLKHIPLSDLNPATERVGWGRGSELFACTVFNLSIYFCLEFCFLQSTSHKLFKTPNILKIRFENTFLRQFSEKIIFGIFWKTENVETFSKNFQFFKNKKIVKST